MPVFDTGSVESINKLNIKGIRYDQFNAYEGQKIITKTGFNKSVLRPDLNYEIIIENISIEYTDSSTYFENSPYAKNILPEYYTNIVTDNHGSKLMNPLPFLLSQNHPNPFNPNTVIRYSLPHPAKVILKIYDLLGREIDVLVDEEKAAGGYEIQFDASKYNFPSGIYFYRLQAGDYIQTRKMICLK